ncbi:MAG: ABC transporter ATP-binding protein [Polynucleobacter sp.]|nr:MAG: ABC transporter ATP-binding protein [Polynucleobacter sp.]
MMSDLPMILETKSLRLEVPSKVLIDRLDWVVREGERWCLIGRNGAGKSSLLKAITGISDLKYQGSIQWMGKDLSSYSLEELASVRSYAEQTPVGGVGLRAIDLVMATQWSVGLSNAQMAIDALKACDVAHLSLSQWQHLSGGERQRVALAACFAQNARVLILDEPTSHLDVGHQITLLQSLIKRSQSCHQTIVASLHDIGLIHRGFTHALLLLENGQCLQGAIDEIVNPQNLELALGHPILEAQTSTGVKVYVPA